MVVILIIAIAVCVGVFFFIKGLVLAKKQNKCKVLFKKYPNAIKVFMLNHDAFASISTHYDRIIGGRLNIMTLA